ncbi:MAG: HAD-IC family P-type ATPase, partial [Abditibacteriaceae bacterium]
MSITKVRLPSSSKRKQTGNPLYSTFWHTPTDTLLKDLGTTSQGLSSAEAEARLPQTVANGLSTRHHSSAWRLLLAQFQSPIILILLFATGLSFFVHDHVGAVIILTIVLISGLLGFWQENGAANAVEKLLALVQVTTAVLRDGKKIEVPMAQVVSGDVIVLGAGDSIPGDSLILESKDLNINEASLTGETYPVEKAPAELPAEATLNARSNTLFMGTNVVSGSATAVVVLTGRDTEFGQVSAHLQLKPPETEFESGIRHFGYLLMEVTLFLVIGIFAVNVYLARPVLDSFLFALALAVGLTPQLLPAIISINLAHGARNMAAQKVIVKRLASIENFGSMNVLCSDKTGTLTEGVVTVQGAFDINGADSAKVLLHAFLNASFETGFTNPIDQAIRSFKPLDISGFQKVSESPYDFIRKRLSIVVDNANTRLMVTKGALSNVLDVCTLAETPNGIVDLATARETIEKQFAQFSNQGFRTLGIAYRSLETSETAAA